MAEPVVIFGGPSPEHDVSILTGLQAARALGDAGTAVSTLYWSKAGDWYEVDATLEGEAFLEGVPRGAKPVRLITGKDGGFVAGGKGLVGRERALEVSAAVNCCHGGPGEDDTLDDGRSVVLAWRDRHDVQDHSISARHVIPTTASARMLLVARQHAVAG